MSELFTLFKGAANHPVTEAHFGHLCMLSHSVSHYRKLMSIGEGWNKDQLVNRKHSLQAQLYIHHNSPVHLQYICFPADMAPICLSIPFHTITSVQDPKIGEVLHFRQGSLKN